VFIFENATDYTYYSYITTGVQKHNTVIVMLIMMMTCNFFQCFCVMCNYISDLEVLENEAKICLMLKHENIGKHYLSYLLLLYLLVGYTLLATFVIL